MSEQDMRILKTVRVLRSWAGVDHQTRRILHELCGLGYLEIVPRTKRRPPGAPERPPSYRLTQRGMLVTKPKLTYRDPGSTDIPAPERGRNC